MRCLANTKYVDLFSRIVDLCQSGSTIRRGRSCRRTDVRPLTLDQGGYTGSGGSLIERDEARVCGASTKSGRNRRQSTLKIRN
jgi:hypothetical protein